MILKFKTDKYWLPVELSKSKGRISLRFSYNVWLKDEVKSMEGARWSPEDKIWTVKDSPRNRFVIEYLSGQNPYAPYDQPLLPYQPKRIVYKHQKEMVQLGLTRRQCILAAEPGTGKTLAAIELMEASGFHEWLWVAPRSAMNAALLEFSKWDSMIWPEMVTYDGLKKKIAEWEAGFPAPKGVIFDEASRIKNPTAQRSQAAKYLADMMRNEYGRDAYIILMSGTPAPRAPSDWYFLSETACPGFIREGDIFKFKRRLAIIEERESIAGGTYPELVTWLDDERRCAKCGQFADAHVITDIDSLDARIHPFKPSVNEVANLYKRMKGLVGVWLKKDVLDLPDKHFIKIHAKPTSDTLRAAKLIVAAAKNVITANTLLRELSDGFMYKEQKVDTVTCSVCVGKKWIPQPIIVAWRCPNCKTEETEASSCPECHAALEFEYQEKIMDCPHCEGVGEEVRMERVAIQVSCPKEDLLMDQLDEHDEIGRLVIYAGFTGSVDRCISIVEKAGWEHIRVDGRGWFSSLGGISDLEMLRSFQDKERKIPRLAFVGQPEAGGMGLTLTESPTIVFYSNSFSAEARQQAQDRIHRPGMDLNRGAKIIDFIHLPTDLKVLENLDKKKRLQDMTLGELNEAIK